METKLLAVLSAGVPVNVTEVCARLGVSRQTFYKYRRRFAEEGAAGLVERSRRPHASPSAVSAAVEERIVRLRKELVVDHGAEAIRFHLLRHPEWLDGAAVPSTQTVHRVLVRRGMVVPHPEKRPRAAWKRFEWPTPNDAWQIDATAWALSDGREIWIMDVLDDHSRVLIAARVADGPTAKAAWEAFCAGVREWGLPARVMSDNGLCFTGRFHGSESDFERELRALGIQHLPSSPGHPQTCGKLERSHQTTKRWLATLPAADSVDELQDQLDCWRGHYNHRRPHRALGGATPAERWTARPAAQPGPPIPGRRRASTHRVSTGGHIGWDHYMVGVGAAFAGQTVLVIANGDHLAIHAQTGLVRQLTIDPARRYQPTGRPKGRPART